MVFLKAVASLGHGPKDILSMDVQKKFSETSLVVIIHFKVKYLTAILLKYLICSKNRNN